MAPGTKPQQQRGLALGFSVASDEFEDIMDNVEIPNGDPWNTNIPVPNQEIITTGATDGHDQSFEDAFVISMDNDEEKQENYEYNTEYLAYLEAKLHRMESRRTNPQKVTAREVLNSLKDTKETQLHWNMQQGESSTEDDSVYSDSCGSSGYSLSKELKRKMFPEQAMNESELLHLLEHDVIEKIFGQIHKASGKQ